MKKILLPATSTAWKDHVLDRISAAEEIGLLDSSDRFNLEQATIIFPDKVDDSSVAKSKPDNSVNELLNIRQEAPGKWNERIECLEDAAQFIQDSCSDKAQVFMFCEAGYSRAGDKFLENYEHILVADNPMLLVDILKSSTLEVAKILRAGRSTRTLGVVNSEVQNKKELNGNKRLFLCDALDGDSVIVCPLLEV